MNTEQTYWFECDDSFLDDFVYAAWQELYGTGRCKKTDPFKEQIKRGFKPGDVVFGSVELCEWAFEQSGVTVPTYLGYPTMFNGCWGRNINLINIDELKDVDVPFFIKPADKIKAFTGKVIDTDFWKEQLLSQHSDIKTYWLQDIKNWKSEWRMFIYNGVAFGMQFYKGNPIFVLSIYAIDDILMRIGENMDELPTAFTVDLGVDDNDRTYIIELNDMWAIGSYGVPMKDYTEAYIARWNEIINKRIT